jgi:translation initiation factor 5A
MNDDGDTKDDVKLPDSEVGERINKLFEEGKDTSMLLCLPFKDGPQPLTTLT